MTLRTLKLNLPPGDHYFDRGNKKFFGDLGYTVRRAKSNKHFLVTRTQGWSDMFGGKLTTFWTLKPINTNKAGEYEIGNMVEISGSFKFSSASAVNEWLRRN
jgi:hypothetical protein